MQINPSQYPLSLYAPTQPRREAEPSPPSKPTETAVTATAGSTPTSTSIPARRAPLLPETFLQTALRGRSVQSFPSSQRAIAAYSAVAETQTQDDLPSRLLGVDLYA